MEKGADIYSFNSEGFAPIHIAAINGHVNVVGFFLAKGMNV